MIHHHTFNQAMQKSVQTFLPTGFRPQFLDALGAAAVLLLWWRHIPQRIQPRAKGSLEL
jgi:hypothetical protein